MEKIQNFFMLKYKSPKLLDKIYWARFFSLNIQRRISDILKGILSRHRSVFPAFEGCGRLCFAPGWPISAVASICRFFCGKLLFE